ncbi:hypothetical protein DFH09DRAFT_448634 [Mycena vulgaris]|nr:hypothetical protein DFH09DRAFT_448634 [Mycena vulgaris]
MSNFLVPPADFYRSGSPSSSRTRPPPYSGPSTPPNPPEAISADTPVHNRVASLLPYSSLSGEFREDAYVVAANELHGKYTLTSPQDFLQQHLPNGPSTPMPPIAPGCLHKVANCRLERDMYSPIIDALQPVVKKGWKFVDTSDSPDPNSKFIQDKPVKPDITLYSDKQPSNNNRCRASDMELFLELKTDPHHDPFADDGTLEKESGDARDTRGQVITYLNAIHASQYRTHCFGVVIIKNKCRLLRMTRSGIEVTTSFDYTKSDFLSTFLWRFSHAAPEIRGIDTTFVPVSRGTALDARSALDAHEQPMWRVSVGVNDFYVSSPFTRSHYFPVGRGTRCFVAVDCRTNQKCLLKDTWRVVGYHPEGEVYARLHHNAVRNIPQVLAAGDVLDHNCGDFPPSWRIPSSSSIRQHVHYRLVLDIVGQPLVDFSSTHALARHILDAVTAHCDAVTKAEVEHRDVSVGNIVVFVDAHGVSRGFLIDWELSKYRDDLVSRAYERAGTRQFMSTRLFAPTSPSPLRTLGDDIESFLLVLLWIATAYAPSRMTPIARAGKLRTFDDPTWVIKMNTARGGVDMVEEIGLTSQHFEHLLGVLFERLRYRYTSDRRYSTEDARKQHADKAISLENHTWLMEELKSALESTEWAVLIDPGVKQDVAVLTPPHGKKRKSDATEYSRVLTKRRRQGGERGPDQEDGDDWGPDDEEDERG